MVGMLVGVWVILESVAAKVTAICRLIGAEGAGEGFVTSMGADMPFQ